MGQKTRITTKKLQELLNTTQDEKIAFLLSSQKASLSLKIDSTFGITTTDGINTFNLITQQKLSNLDQGQQLILTHSNRCLSINNLLQFTSVCSVNWVLSNLKQW